MRNLHTPSHSPRLAALTALLALAAAAPALAGEGPPVAVTPAVQTAIVEGLTLTGTLTSPRRAALAAEVSGRVDRLAVEAGDRVKTGQVLLELDDEIARLELAQARAALREAEAEQEDARRRLAEAEDLARRAGIADTEVRARESEVRTDGAIVDRRKAELAFRSAKLKRHSLAAPFEGVIARRMCEIGEWIDPDKQVLELVAIDRLRLDLQVPERYFGRVAPGTPVSLRIAAGAQPPREAGIDELVPVSDPRARTFLARVGLENEDGLLTPGMSARATLRMDTGEQGVVVPRDALIRYPDGRVSVWVVNGGESGPTVSERRVRPGLVFGGQVEIVAGLEAGTSIVVEGNESLLEGQRVQVAER